MLWYEWMGALLLLGCMDMRELEIDTGREETCAGTTIRGFALHGWGALVLEVFNFVY